MAHFKLAPGSAGDWSGSSYSLSVTTGETFEVILCGGGPQGPDGTWEDLQVDIDPHLHVTGGLVLKPTKPLGSNEKLYRYTVTSPGTLHLHARRPSGPDWAAPLLVVCAAAPPKTTGVAMFCAKELLPLIPLWGNTEVYSFDTPDDFWRIFDKLRDAGRRVFSLTIVSHGQAGAIHTRGKVVGNALMWRSARNKGYDAVFTTNAFVTFKGCNAAEGPEGREFLEEFGKTFFLRGGGTVTASDSMFVGVGPYTTVFGPDGYAQMWGKTISIKFKPGGVIDTVQEASTWQ